MAKIIRDAEKKTTKAVINGASRDAVKHIRKIYSANESENEKKANKRAEGKEGCKCMDSLVPCIGAALMHDDYSGTVKCFGDDKYDESVGEDLAVQKAMMNHQSAFKKAVIRWQVAVLKKVQRVSPETFAEAYSKVAR